MTSGKLTGGKVEILFKKTQRLLDALNDLNDYARKLAEHHKVIHAGDYMDIKQNELMFRALLTAEHEGNKPDLTALFPQVSRCIQ
jgi:hypothetical protein